MKRRTLKGLKSSVLLESAPHFIRKVKHRGARLAGIVYEKKVAQRLQDMYGPRVLHNPWFKYIDKRGEGWCCADILILPEKDEPLIIGECKLTSTKKAFKQLKNFYVPVSRLVWPQYEIRAIQIAKNLSLGWDGPLVGSLYDEYEEQFPGDFATWNWRDV